MVTLGDETASNLLCACQLAVIGIEFLVEDQKPMDLRPAHARLGAERAVDRVHVLSNEIIDQGMARELLVRRVSDIVPFGPVADRHQVDVDETGDRRTMVAEGNRLFDIGVELEFVLDVLGREE